MGGPYGWKSTLERPSGKGYTQNCQQRAQTHKYAKNWHREFIPRNALTYIEQPLTITLDDLKPQIKENTLWPHWDVTLG